MTKRNATNLPASIRRRHTRKETPDISSIAECSPDLFNLHKAIAEEVETLEDLTCAIEEADTEEDLPIEQAHTRRSDWSICANVPAKTASEKDVDQAGWTGLIPADLLSACKSHDDEEASLRSYIRQESKRRRKQRRCAFAAFDLSNVNEQITDFLADSPGSSNSLELPDFSKMQRMQVRALAAVYGLEPRACGRRGQTLFRTDRAGMPLAGGEAQVRRLLACSFQGGKPSKDAKAEMDAALRHGRASLKRPIAATNKGSILLKQMGWSEGSGLGVKEQGMTEPVSLHPGQRRRGLGSQ